jgi:hypothetical protein
MKLFNHVYLVARLRMGGKITSLSHVPLWHRDILFFLNVILFELHAVRNLNLLHFRCM